MVNGWLHKQDTTRQQDEEEEEILTRYESKEEPLPNLETQSNGSGKPPSKDPRLLGWEFKIVRAKRDLFRDPAVFQKLCQEEQQAGWIMLEKLDDRRVRFKRPIALREMMQAETLPFDPYRCRYGSSFTPMTLIWCLTAVLAATLPAYIGYTYVSAALANSRQDPPSSPAPQLPFPKSSPKR